MPATNRILTLLPLFSLTVLAACDGKAVVETENHPPSTPEVRIGPNEPATGDDLVAVIVTESQDPEGDAVTYRYDWLQDGLPRTDLTTDTVPAAETTRGEVWEVKVTPNDGEADGTGASARITIGNTAPTVEVAIDPASPTAEDDLSAAATVDDADGGDITVSYAWTRDGAATDEIASTVSASAIRHGEVWEVAVTATDDAGEATTARASVTIGNSAPEVLAVELTPYAPTAADDIVATPHAHDTDGDDLSYTYTWYVDGNEVQTGPSDTLAAGNFAKHQRVSVEVVPFDGAASGSAFASADVEVINSAPVAVSAEISPTRPRR